MKIIVEKKATITEEVEVTFPLFIEWSDVGDDSKWTRITLIEESGACRHLYKTTRGYSSREIEFELKIDRIDLKSDLADFLKHEIVDASVYVALMREFQDELSYLPKVPKG